MKRLAPRPSLAKARLLTLSVATALATIVVGTATIGTALADEEGKTGRVIRLRVLTQGSDDHPSYHGAITIKERTSGAEAEYRWGGSSCPGQRLTDPQIELLARALEQRHRTLVAPRYIIEGAGSRCLVGFELVAG